MPAAMLIGAGTLRGLPNASSSNSRLVECFAGMGAIRVTLANLLSG